MQKIWKKSKDATVYNSLATSQNSSPPKLASVHAFLATAHPNGYKILLLAGAIARKPVQMDTPLSQKSVNVIALENVQVDFL